MKNMSVIGRAFYAVAITGMGLVTLFYAQLPYMLLPPVQLQIPGLVYILGAVLVVTGVCTLMKKVAKPVSLLSGSLFLLIFCFCYVPYQLFISPDNGHLADWENAEKELAFAGGAFVIAGCFTEQSRSGLMRFLARLIPAGDFFFAVPVLSFGILHFLLAKEASVLIPAWIPGHMFWMYLSGAGLICSGAAIILNIVPRLAATLSGAMILIWFVLLHIPRVVVAAPADRADEMISAFLALAYSGIAFVIAGRVKKA